MNMSVEPLLVDKALTVVRGALPLNRAAMTQVEAEGDTDSRPRPGFTPRKGKGVPFLGKSSSTPPKAKVRSEMIFHQALVAPVMEAVMKVC